MSLTIALETLGCKVNQYESSHLMEVLQGAGHQLVSFKDSADAYIVHSCTVTSKAAFQTRQLLRRAGRNNPHSLVIVVGCDAQLEADRIADERLATHIIGSTEKHNLLRWLDVSGSFSSPCKAVSDVRLAARLEPMPTRRMHSGRARAFLKVQDGCDSFCSYCIVPYTRGKSRSLSPDHVRTQLDRYLENGYREVVFSGIHLGQWGRDFDPRQDLLDLLRFLDRATMPPRIRLSSLEPMEWSQSLLDYLRASPWICQHFHVPLQSGSREILKSMGRPYTPQQYAELVSTLHETFPRASIGADVMVGYPGETERQFGETVELISGLPLSYLHVFPFSPRPGTTVAERTDRATGHALRQRAKIMRNLDARKRRSFRQGFLGHCVEVLMETEIEAGVWRGTSDNYIQVVFPVDRPVLPGSLANIRLTRVGRQGVVLGELVSIP